MPTSTYTTASDIPQDVRTRTIALLNEQLADAIDLGLQLKHAHWNVKGPQFISLHALFDELAEELEESIDDLAERAVELGGVAGGTLQVVTRCSRLQPYPLSTSAGLDHCRHLRQPLAALASTTRAAIEIATHLGEADTADLLTSVSSALDKMLWKVEAHLQADS